MRSLSHNENEEHIPYLSSADTSFNYLLDFLTKNFPDKSIYEK